MLSILLDKASKRFQYEWIFKNISLTLEPQSKVAVTGSNGSGKSTLLKCLAGLIPLTEGKIAYHSDHKEISDADIYAHLAISAPYLELPEEFTLSELLDFHFKFKKKSASLSIDDMVEIMYLLNQKINRSSIFPAA